MATRRVSKNHEEELVEKAKDVEDSEVTIPVKKVKRHGTISIQDLSS